MIKIMVLLLSAAFFFAANAWGDTPSIEIINLGQIGPAVPPAEEDLLTQAQSLLESLPPPSERDKATAFQRYREQLAARQPPEEATKPATRTIRPGYRIAQTLTAGDGTVLAREGQILYPLDYIQLDHGWLFFNANDPRHRQFAIDMWESNDVYLAAVSGDPIEAEASMAQERGERRDDLLRTAIAERHIQVWNATPSMIAVMGVKKIPSLVTQKGNILKVEELPTHGGEN